MELATTLLAVALAIIVLFILVFLMSEFFVWLDEHKAWEASQPQPIIQLWSGIDKPRTMTSTQYLNQLKGIKS